MRHLLTAFTLLCLIFITPRSLPSPTPFESCGCGADDGSCSVNGTCPRGCLAYCPSGHCRVTCVGDAFEETLDLSAMVTLQLNEADGKKVTAALARATGGAHVMFNPRRPDATVNLNFKDAPLWDVLETLSAEGSIQIAREDFGHLRSVRHSFLSGERMAVCFHNVTVKRLAADLSFLSGRDVYVAAGDAKALVDYKGKGVNFEEIVAQAAETAGVQMLIR